MSQRSVVVRCGLGSSACAPAFVAFASTPRKRADRVGLCCTVWLQPNLLTASEACCATRAFTFDQGPVGLTS